MVDVGLFIDVRKQVQRSAKILEASLFNSGH